MDFEGWPNDLKADYMKNAKSAFWTYLYVDDDPNPEKVKAVEKALNRFGEEAKESWELYDSDDELQPHQVVGDTTIYPYKSDPWFEKNKGRFPRWQDKLGSVKKLDELNSEREAPPTFDVRSKPPEPKSAPKPKPKPKPKKTKTKTTNTGIVWV
jgi:hypothetical protein